MKITAVETINLGEFPNVLWVHIHTDEGLVGLGETFYAVAPVAAHIHETCAPYLLGKNPLQIDSGEPTLSYKDYALGETRFKSLHSANSMEAERLLALGQEDVNRRGKFYRHMAAMSFQAEPAKA